MARSLKTSSSASRYLFIFLLLVSGLAKADDWKYGGHLKYELSASDFPSNNIFALASTTHPIDQFLDFRYKAEKVQGNWSYQVHYEVLALYGDTVKALSTLSSVPGLSAVPNDSKRLFNLTQSFGSGDYFAGVHRIDRLVASYTNQQLVLRFGRQAISWGNGLFFNPMDLVNPFSPTAISKEYKTGEDMLYGQWLYDNGSDLQVIVLPRRNSAGEIDDGQSSYAIKYHGMHQQFEYQLMAARHYGDYVAGLGLSSDFKGAVLRSDIVSSSLASGTQFTSAVVNSSYSWMWGQHNVTGNIEYYRNGVGIDNGNYSSVFVSTSLLAQRLARGEIFGVGRNYLAGSLTIELTPRFVVSPTLIQNLDDQSGILQTVFNYDWKEEAPVTFGFALPYGSLGSEYGGIYKAPGQYYGPGAMAFFRVGYYF